LFCAKGKITAAKSLITLGADVRIFLGHQHHRFAQSPHRHDEPFLPTHLRQLSKFIIKTKEQKNKIAK